MPNAIQDGLTNQQRYNARHPERALAAQKKYKTAHPDRVVAALKKYRETHPEEIRASRLKHRDANRNGCFLRSFGITLAHRNGMIAAQENRCGICRRKMEEGKRGPQVDHDHKTGKVRAILCLGCNAGLGLFGDSIKSLQAAIEYLRKHRNRGGKK